MVGIIRVYKRKISSKEGSEERIIMKEKEIDKQRTWSEREEWRLKYRKL